MMFLSDDLATFRRGRGKDRKPRKRKLLSDIGTVADKAVYGGGAGFAGVGLLPFRSKRVDRALRSKAMGKVPLVGKGIRQMALETANRKGNFLAANLPAQTTAGLIGAGAGIAYGLNKVRKNRKTNNYK